MFGTLSTCSKCCFSWYRNVETLVWVLNKFKFICLYENEAQELYLLKGTLVKLLH